MHVTVAPTGRLDAVDGDGMKHRSVTRAHPPVAAAGVLATAPADSRLTRNSLSVLLLLLLLLLRWPVDRPDEAECVDSIPAGVGVTGIGQVQPLCVANDRIVSFEERQVAPPHFWATFQTGTQKQAKVKRVVCT